jgi:hypothetical protein
VEAAGEGAGGGAAVGKAQAEGRGCAAVGVFFAKQGGERTFTRQKAGAGGLPRRPPVAGRRRRSAAS